MAVDDMKDYTLQHATSEAVTLTNANLVLDDEVIRGTLRVQDGKIAQIDTSNTEISGAIDCNGDYVSAGLVELHTDNLERHLQPRPGVKWPQKAAVFAHDGELASVGITTVFDALRVGSIVSDSASKYGKYAREVASQILSQQKAGALRINHFLHLRAEVCSETLLDELAEFSVEDRIGIVSIMDHTPGQRQFRDTSKMEEYLVGKYGMSKDAISTHFDKLYGLRDTLGAKHEEGAAAFGRSVNAVLASHDDTTRSDVATSVEKGVRIAEFPTTLEAAAANVSSGISVMMGAPNLLRGGSHSGNVAAQELAEFGVLDMLSSDYVPASLLMGAVRHGLDSGNMAEGLKMVTKSPAQAVEMTDRGELALGKRADLVRFEIHDTLPKVKSVWNHGLRVA